MTNGRLPWFPCEPRELLSALTGLDPDAKLVYLITLLRIYEDGKAVEEDAKSLANRTLLPMARVQKALDFLIHKKKLITSDGLISNEKAEQVIARSKKVQRERSKRASDAAKYRHGKTQTNQRKVRADAVPMRAQEQGQLQEQELPYLQNPPTNIGGSKRSSHRPKSADDYSEDFMKAWTSYPRRFGTKKPEAYRAWCKITPEQQATVLRVMPKWSREMAKREQEFIAHFSTYLNQRMFETLESALVVAREQADITDPKDFTDDRWSTICAMYRITNDWKQPWGPPPGYPDCLLPVKFIEQMSKSPLDAHSAAV